MSKNTKETDQEKPLEAMALEVTKDKYKLAFVALRWAREIKQKENLPDSIPILVLRSLREILTGKVSIAQVEKLPPIVKVVAPPQAQVPAAPTITLNVEDEEEKKGKGKEK